MFDRQEYRFMAQCITCGAELHPERARKYNYCMARECQEKNAKGLTMVAVGMNKAADELVILDERTREELASGRYQDQRRGSFGPLPQAPRPQAPAGPAPPAEGSPGPARPSVPRTQRHGAARRPWTASQEKLALLYNQQGLRPDEIAQKLGISRYMVTQIILDARNRRKA
jgi:hypothetical protein